MILRVDVTAVVLGLLILLVGVDSVPVAAHPQGKTGEKRGELGKAKERADATEDEAKAALDLFGQMRREDGFAIRIAAVERLAGVRHKLVAKELGKQLRTNDVDFKIAVAFALALQDPKYATKPLLVAFKARPNRAQHGVRGAILECLGLLNARPAVKYLVQTLKDQNENPEVIKGAIVALGSMKEVRALDELIKIFEVDPNDQPVSSGASAPPPSYWKRIWERWQVVETPLRQALEKITGQKFENGKKAREWYERNKRKLGLRR